MIVHRSHLTPTTKPSMNFIARQTPFIFALVCCLWGIALPVQAEPTINNADFAEWEGSYPDGWHFRGNKQRVSQSTDIDVDHPDVETALRIEIVSDQGGRLGEILQKLKLEPYTRYRISGDLRSTRPGLGLYQVKVIKNKRELDRLNSGKSTTDWRTIEIEFDTRSANEVQVLPRYSQKGQFNGATVWFTNLTIEKLGAGAPPPDPMRLEVADDGSDQYVTMLGSGDRSGTSWQNAWSGQDFETAVMRAGPGNTVYVGSGMYPGVALELTAGGDEGRPLRIVGEDTGRGRPQFVSDFQRDKPDKTGATFLLMQAAVGFVEIENLEIVNYCHGVVMYGPNRGVRIRKIDVIQSRQGIVVDGGAQPNRPDSGTHDLVIEDCNFRFYTKRGIRFRGGVHHSEIINCVADSGGEDWAVEAFPMGFSVEGPDHHLTFRGCTAANNWHKNGSNYWNADGFVAEREADHITWIDCLAYGNTDGGWDVKARNPTLINCVSVDNKRNFRVWANRETPATFENCFAGYATHRGGSGNANGLHVANRAGVNVSHMTFVDNQTAIDVDSKGDPTTVTVNHALIFDPEGKAVAIENPSGEVELNDSMVIDRDESGSDPEFAHPQADWRGGDDAFDSATYPAYGYRSDR